jgi:mono/diheme cytochrome c family protein
MTVTEAVRGVPQPAHRRGWRLGIAAGLAVAAVAMPAASGAGQVAPATDEARAAHAALIDQYCVACHNERRQIPEGHPLLLDQLDLRDVADDAAAWEQVARKLRAGAMPPPGRPRPESAAADALAAWLETALDRVAAVRPDPGPQPAVRRLTRTEYGNAVRDLLALDALPKELDLVSLLPADNTVGFDNVAELLFVTPTLLEAYITAARKISRIALGDPAQPVMVDTYPLPLEMPQDDRLDGFPLGTRGGIAIRRYFPLDGEYEIAVELTRRGRDSEQLEIALDGERVELVTLGGRGDSAGASGPLRRRVPVAAGPRTVGVTFLKKTAAATEALLSPFTRGRGGQPAVAAVTNSGPYGETAPGETPSRQRILICGPTASDGPGSTHTACARRVVSALLRRAYRRPVTDADLAPVLAFYAEGQVGAGFERGVERALQRILISPEFLLRVEAAPADAAPGEAYPVTDLELATRLSFFLWSSLPDDELLDLAAAGQLRAPGALEGQVTRMLADSRATSLVSNFVAQWLYLRDLQARRPNDRLFPDFDDGLRRAMLRETELVFETLVREDRSVVELLTSRATFVNERLARHYGIPNVYGSHFRRVTLDEDSVRGGLLGMGSILTLTSYATRTSPVVRGKWVLENILGAPPPPPPPNVPALRDTGADGRVLSMRDRMAQHRANPVCASCHASMDPLGLALENFDAVGRWRTRDESGAAIDASGALPDGTAFEGLAGLRTILAARHEAFVTTLTEKLLMYALGRELGPFDQPTVRGVVREAARHDYRVSAIIQAIVDSTPFQMRRSES